MGVPSLPFPPTAVNHKSMLSIDNLFLLCYPLEQPKEKLMQFRNEN